MTTDMKPELENKVRAYFTERNMEPQIKYERQPIPAEEGFPDYREVVKVEYQGNHWLVETFPHTGEVQVITTINGKTDLVAKKSIEEVLNELPALQERAA